MKTDSRLKHILNIEGIDGTGKKTVSAELEKILTENYGAKVHTVHFPAYETPTGALTHSFLMGEIVGDPATSPPILSSLFYTVDRLTYYKNNPEIFTDYDILIFDRSYMSSYFFQTAKLRAEHPKDPRFFNRTIPDYARLFYKLEITNSPLYKFVDCIETFLLYHPDTETNAKLMGDRVLDKNESNIEYLDMVQNYSMELYNKITFHKTRCTIMNAIDSLNIFNAFKFGLVPCSSFPDGLKPVSTIARNILINSRIPRPSNY